MFYKFRQNNSNGFFIGPAINVVVEADTEEEAVDIAVQNGVYFDLAITDCSCCGRRWSRYADESEDIPPISEWDSMIHKDWGVGKEGVNIQLIVRKEVA